MPMPRPANAKVSGIEISRTRTKIVASEPSAITTRLSGTLAGSSIPARRNAARPRTARPTKKTSFPRTPVCQPITASVGPSIGAPDVAYQSVNAESASTRPAIHVSRSPAAQTPAAARGNGASRRGACSNRPLRGGGEGSAVCTAEVWAFSKVRAAPIGGPSDRGNPVHRCNRSRRLHSFLGVGGSREGRVPLLRVWLRRDRLYEAPCLPDVLLHDVGAEHMVAVRKNR